MTTTAAGIVSTTVSTAAAGALAPLGFELEEPAESGGDTRTGQGPRIWVYVQNDAAAATAWLPGTIVTRLAAATTELGIIAPVNAPTASVMGVAQHAIPAGSFGFILKRGLGEVLADTGGIAANLPMVVGNAVAGRADTTGVAATTYALGFSTEGVAAAALATCWINCPGA